MSCALGAQRLIPEGCIVISSKVEVKASPTNRALAAITVAAFASLALSFFAPSVYMIFNQLARKAEGIPELPLTAADVWKMSLVIPGNWYVVFVQGVLMGILCVWSASTPDAAVRRRGWILVLLGVLIARFFLDWGLPLNLQAYGYLHYAITTLGFLIVLSCTILAPIGAARLALKYL